jgi:hypothetical protein
MTLLVTVARKSSACTLSISPGMPGPHDFAVRQCAARQANVSASIAPRPTFVTTRNAPSGGTGCDSCSMSYEKKKQDSLNRKLIVRRSLKLLGNLAQQEPARGGLSQRVRAKRGPMTGSASPPSRISSGVHFGGHGASAPLPTLQECASLRNDDGEAIAREPAFWQSAHVFHHSLIA